MKNREEKILCAAIYFNNGVEYKEQPKNILVGIVVCGYRHNNCFNTLFTMFNRQAVENIAHDKEKLVCGFLTSKDRFVNRADGYAIAKEQDQLLFDHDDTAILTSEDLY